LCDLCASRVSQAWTGAFIVAAALTRVTGFGFAAPFGPSHVVGIISLALLAGLILAPFHFAGSWRSIYAIGQPLTQFLLVFVLTAKPSKSCPPWRPFRPPGTSRHSL
jgi:hypothetical protein